VKHSEWLEVGAQVTALWPGKAAVWEPGTMAAAYELFQNVPLEAALSAVRRLAEEGREFAPAPGVVLSAALQVIVDATPKLQDSDLTRELTAEERDRARRQAAALSGAQASTVVAAWMEFAAHAKTCLTCAAVARRCRQTGLSSAVIATWHRDVCAEGRPTFEAWRYAVDQLRVLASPGSGVQQEAGI
jgi:hypothetical protein